MVTGEGEGRTTNGMNTYMIIRPNTLSSLGFPSHWTWGDDQYLLNESNWGKATGTIPVLKVEWIPSSHILTVCRENELPVNRSVAGPTLILRILRIRIRAHINLNVALYYSILLFSNTALASSGERSCPALVIQAWPCMSVQLPKSDWGSIKSE